jgi:hypothetical protein
MVELDGERVLENISPGGRDEPQPRRIRHEGAVDQGPGVINQPGMQPRHQRAEIDLKKQ